MIKKNPYHVVAKTRTASTGPPSGYPAHSTRSTPGVICLTLKIKNNDDTNLGYDNVKQLRDGPPKGYPHEIIDDFSKKMGGEILEDQVYDTGDF